MLLQLLTLDSFPVVPVIALVVGIIVSSLTFYYQRRQNKFNALVEGSKTRGEISDIYAACLKRDKIELVGSHVDKLDWIFKRKEQPLDFYDLAELVNSLTTDDFKNKDLNHNDFTCCVQIYCIL